MRRRLVALLASLLAGGLIVQGVAESGRGDETLILAYMLLVPAAVAVAVLLGLAARGQNARARLDRTALRLGGLCLAMGAAILAFEAHATGFAGAAKLLPLVLALTGASAIMSGVQWLVLRNGLGWGAEGT